MWVPYVKGLFCYENETKGWASCQKKKICILKDDNLCFIFPAPYPVLGKLFFTSDLIKAYTHTEPFFFFFIIIIIFTIHTFEAQRGTNLQGLKSGESFALETIIFIENYWWGDY